MEKQKLLYQQARLHDRGAAEMVLQTVSASKGECPALPHPAPPPHLRGSAGTHLRTRLVPEISDACRVQATEMRALLSWDVLTLFFRVLLKDISFCS